MVYRHLMTFLGGAVLLIGCGILLAGYWPTPTSQQALSLSTRLLAGGSKDHQVQDNTSPPSANLALTWPKAMWAGDQRKIQLELNPIIPSPKSISQSNLDGPADYHIVAEARIEIDELNPHPGVILQQPWPDHKPLTFAWTIQPDHPGDYQGNVWFYLNLVTSDGKIAQRIPVSDQDFQVKVRGLDGIAVASIRNLGIVIFLAGLLLILLPMKGQFKFHAKA